MWKIPNAIVMKKCRKKEMGSQSNNFFSDGTNLCINQTCSNKNKLQLLLDEAVVKKVFRFCYCEKMY